MAAMTPPLRPPLPPPSLVVVLLLPLARVGTAVPGLDPAVPPTGGPGSIAGTLVTFRRVPTGAAGLVGTVGFVVAELSPEPRPAASVLVVVVVVAVNTRVVEGVVGGAGVPRKHTCTQNKQDLRSVIALDRKRTMRWIASLH